MKFKGKVAVWWYLLIILLNVVLIGLVVKYHLRYISFFYLVPMGLLDVYLIPVCIANYIKIEKNRVFIRFGLSKEEFSVGDILSMQRVDKFCLSYCASMDGVLLVCRNRDKIVVSLQDNKAFMDELHRVNRKIKLYL